MDTTRPFSGHFVAKPHLAASSNHGAKRSFAAVGFDAAKYVWPRSSGRGGIYCRSAAITCRPRPLRGRKRRRAAILRHCLAWRNMLPADLSAMRTGVKTYGFNGRRKPAPACRAAVTCRISGSCFALSRHAAGSAVLAAIQRSLIVTSGSSPNTYFTPGVK